MKQQELLPIGTVLDSGVRKYTIKSVLGQGGFGITYLAISRVLVDNIPIEASFAVKEHFVSSMNERQGSSVRISNPNNTGEIQESIDSFLVEAGRLNKLSLNHPGIVRVNERFRANNTAYYVMEYVKGQSLRDYVKQSALGRLSEEEALQLFRPIAETVGYLHDNKVTHLDIKPDNILIRENGQPVVIDFGLSKHYSAKGTPTSTIKAAGCSAGYSPMEQYAGITSFTPEADIYALAATLLYMLAGKDPMISTEINSDVILSSLPVDVSTSTANAIVKAMATLKRDRTHHVGEFVNQLYKKDSDSSDSSANTQDASSDVELENATQKILPLSSIEEDRDEDEGETESNIRSITNQIVLLLAFALLFGLLITGLFYTYRSYKIEADHQSEIQMLLHKDEDTLGYVDLGLPSGTLWAKCNIGANDKNEVGAKYAYGALISKEEGFPQNNEEYEREVGFVDRGQGIIGTQYDVATKKMGKEWQLPSGKQMEELINNCKIEILKKGLEFIGPNGKKMFLPYTFVDPPIKAAYYWSGDGMRSCLRYENYDSGCEVSEGSAGYCTMAIRAVKR